jgi:hypothetical protein
MERSITVSPSDLLLDVLTFHQTEAAVACFPARTGFFKNVREHPVRHGLHRVTSCARCCTNTRLSGMRHTFGIEASSESQRDSVPKPRVARNELPWESVRRKLQPQWGCGHFHPCGERNEIVTPALRLLRFARDRKGPPPHIGGDTNLSARHQELPETPAWVAVGRRR